MRDRIFLFSLRAKRSAVAPQKGSFLAYFFFLTAKRSKNSRLTGFA